ncbi:shikimate kinase [Desulfurispira natronophila]|uniref:Shikimate kinase n=1 Tax=Desulfurispira natronophila TaxID=682562 RepID=A0A7W7Y308_9BACT|nr:shikimate kinase [Desulfurispira natronophila]MBB5020862.1 shikimate kinase [Desulfurispira natronophila]
MQRHIVLTGFMGSGKSTVGRLVAQKLGCRFVDIDDVIEKHAGMTIMEIFNKHGEIYFRDLESAAVRQVLDSSPSVIATGGGTLMRNSNLTELKKRGVLFYLSAQPSVLHERVGLSNNRPLVKEHPGLDEFSELLASRVPFYRKSDHIIEVDHVSPIEVADCIIDMLELA